MWWIAIVLAVLAVAIGVMQMERGYVAQRQGLGQFLAGVVTVFLGLVLIGVFLARYLIH
jgi:hypothetical protein